MIFWNFFEVNCVSMLLNARSFIVILTLENFLWISFSVLWLLLVSNSKYHICTADSINSELKNFTYLFKVVDWCSFMQNAVLFFPRFNEHDRFIPLERYSLEFFFRVSISSALFITLYENTKHPICFSLKYVFPYVAFIRYVFIFLST